MKRWPVGSVAQSAIQAAIQARSRIKDLSRIKQVRVFAEEGAYDHLVKIRQDPWNPISRETADHSLPYIVSAAVLDGTIRVNSFTPNVFLNPERQAFIKKVTCAPAPELGSHAMGKHKRVVDLNEKLRENVEPIAGAQRAARLTSLLWSLDKVKSTRELTKLLAFGGKIDIDSVKVRER